MKKDEIAAARCEINRLKGIRHYLSVAEIKKAREIQALIRAQAEMDDEIMVLELQIAKLDAENRWIR